MTDDRSIVSGNMPDDYDLEMDHLMRHQSVMRTQPRQLRSVPFFGIGGTKNHSIQTFRIAGEVLEEREDGTVKRDPPRYVTAYEVTRGTKVERLMIPDDVFAVMVRQREGLATAAARRAGRANVERRKERGEQVGNPEALAK